MEIYFRGSICSRTLGNWYYLSSHWVTQRDDKLQIFCKAWPVKNYGRFDKNSFFLDWDTHLISCPNQVSVSFEAGKTVHFPLSECATCPLRKDCTNSKRGRSVSIHPDQALMALPYLLC